MSLAKVRTFPPQVLVGRRKGSLTEFPIARGCVDLRRRGTLRVVASPPESMSQASPAEIGGLCLPRLLGGRIWQETRERWVQVPWPLPWPWSRRFDAPVLASGWAGALVLGRWGRLIEPETFDVSVYSKTGLKSPKRYAGWVSVDSRARVHTAGYRIYRLYGLCRWQVSGSIPRLGWIEYALDYIIDTFANIQF